MTTAPPKPGLEAHFSGAGVAAFESRHSKVMVDCIRDLGGKPLVAPTMQQIPLEKNPEIAAFGERLIAGELEIIIFMTGIGTRFLLETLQERHGHREIIEKLKRVTTVVRGPKPIAVLSEYGIRATLTVQEPSTWNEILETLDTGQQGISLSGSRVAIQEYGESNSRLIRGLKQRGAHVIQLPVYRWALPDDTGPLKKVMREIVEGRAQFALFTNGMQVKHLMRAASESGRENELRSALKKVVIASIGPNCTEAILETGLSVDFESARPNMKEMVSEIARDSEMLLKAKSDGPRLSVLNRLKDRCVPDPSIRQSSPFMKACRMEETDYTPVWLMRQAGRYLPEYSRVRNKVSFLELCKNPDLATEVTVSCCERINADAAIIFSDILLIIETLGLHLEYLKQEGPVITGAPKSLGDIEGLPEIDPRESLPFVFEAIRRTRACLRPETPLIGFAGAPFTLASYMIEGGGSRTFLQTKRMMYGEPQAWHALMAKLSRGIAKHLCAQIEAGADAVQIFDSWVGCLGPEDYREFVSPHSSAVVQALPAGVPVIHFGTGTGPMLEEICRAGGSVIGLDYRVQLDRAWRQIGFDRAVQGNLDPMVLFASPEVIRKRVKRILDQANGRAGHIFNLGHGVLPGTPVENVCALIEFVHELSRRK